MGKATNAIGNWLTALLLTALLLLAACGHEQRAWPARKVTTGKAKLPPTPDLNPPTPKAHHKDGSWTVHGIVHSGAKARQGQVVVRGYVAALHTCPDLKKGCKPAPYLQLTDAASREGRRLLVGGPIDPARDKYEVGKQTDVRGHFVTSSADGLYFAPQGMVLLSPPADPEDADAGATEANGK